MPVIEMSTVTDSFPTSGPVTQQKPEEALRKQSTHEFTREHLIEAVAAILTAMINRADPEASSKQPKTVFHAKKAPKISLHKYLARIAEFTKCSDKCLLFSLIYIDRVSQIVEDFNLDMFNVHR